MIAPILKTERLTLRGPEAQDLEPFVEYATSDRSVHTGGPTSAKGAWRDFAAEIGHWHIRGYGMWTVTTHDDDTALGLIGHWHPDGWPEREIGWLLWPGAEGKGIAFEAARAIVDYTFETLKWDTMVSYIAYENKRSVSLAERLGAVLDPAGIGPGDGKCFVYRHVNPGAAK